MEDKNNNCFPDILSEVSESIVNSFYADNIQCKECGNVQRGIYETMSLDRLQKLAGREHSAVECI